MIQIRNVPDDIHARLKAKAAKARLTLSDYVLEDLRHLAETPTVDEIRARIRQLPPVHVSESIADAIREEREAR
ncbi:MAG: FitA-like ribbon-helix-helix domain-containing protein [Chloroflexota bacterium]